MADYHKAFITFTNRIKPNGTLLVCADEPNAASLLKTSKPDINAFSYGESPEADYRIENLCKTTHNNLQFAVVFREEKLQTLTMRVPGKHNALNACSVLAACHQSDLDLDSAAQALYEFEGSQRRFDIRGIVNDITFIDDYAHHPTEIAATMQSARQHFSDHRIWVVWQPHTYSRTITLMDDFVQCFAEADCVVVTEVYASREKNDTFSARLVAEKIQKDRVYFTPKLEDAEQLLLNKLQPRDVVIVCSAGSAIQISQTVFETLSNQAYENDKEKPHV